MTIAECLTVRNLHGSMHSMLSEAFMKLSNIQYFLIDTDNSQYMEKIQLLVDFRENPETWIFQPTLLSRCTPRHLYWLAWVIYLPRITTGNIELNSYIRRKNRLAAPCTDSETGSAVYLFCVCDLCSPSMRSETPGEQSSVYESVVRPTWL